MAERPAYSVLTNGPDRGISNYPEAAQHYHTAPTDVASLEVKPAVLKTTVSESNRVKSYGLQNQINTLLTEYHCSVRTKLIFDLRSN